MSYRPCVSLTHKLLRLRISSIAMQATDLQQFEFFVLEICTRFQISVSIAESLGSLMLI